MRASRLTSLFAAVLLAAPAVAGDVHHPAVPLAVIVSDDVDGSHWTRALLALIFERKQEFWPNRERMQPVNLPAAHPLRHAFSQCVLGRAPEALDDYWRERYFHGVLPPRVLASEAAVTLFVASTRGAIGYISACPVDRKVNVVLTFGEVPNCPRRNSVCRELQD